MSWLPAADGPLIVTDAIYVIGIILEGIGFISIADKSVEAINNYSENLYVKNKLEANAQSVTPESESLEKEPSDDNQDEVNQSAKDSKKVDGNKAANKFAEEKGYDDAHDLKRSVLKDANAKDQNISHYDIYNNAKTGETFLKHKQTGKYIPE